MMKIAWIWRTFNSRFSLCALKESNLILFQVNDSLHASYVILIPLFFSPKTLSISDVFHNFRKEKIKYQSKLVLHCMLYVTGFMFFFLEIEPDNNFDMIFLSISSKEWKNQNCRKRV